MREHGQTRKPAGGKGGVRVRIAPSPTGDPHIGTAYMALLNYAFAHHEGGQFILRLEDTDRERYRERSVQAILSALEWLGIPPDEGPIIGGPVGPYVQSERLAIYRQYAMQLIAQGDAYYCFCTRERLAEMRRKQEAAGQPTRYDRHCRDVSDAERAQWLRDGVPHVIRMNMPDTGITTFTDVIRGKITFANALLDDQVLLKADGYPTYHLAVVVDDHLMGITHVTRAEDWISSTPKHLILYAMFGWQAPQFVHLPLLRNPDRSKVSKRCGHTSLQWYRDEGYLPEALLNYLALLGWSHPEEREIFSVAELVEAFRFDRFNTGGPIFDLEKLRWLNGVYLRALSVDELYLRAKPFMQRAGLVSAVPSANERAYATRCIILEQEKVRTLAEFPHHLDFMFTPDFPYADEAIAKWLRPAPAHVAPAFRSLQERLVNLMPEAFTADALEAIVRTTADMLKVTAAAVIHPTRAAMSGRTTGPSLFHMMEVLGRGQVLARLSRALAFVTGAAPPAHPASETAAAD